MTLAKHQNGVVIVRQQLVMVLLFPEVHSPRWAVEDVAKQQHHLGIWTPELQVFDTWYQLTSQSRGLFVYKQKVRPEAPHDREQRVSPHGYNIPYLQTLHIGNSEIPILIALQAWELDIVNALRYAEAVEHW
ncbi:MAG: hypothetical protein AUI36_16350 [Cyanobacteria bacterium 13_1_40CM_2_61_4]|nr:MAG: hypothetical protein AUI36_16350 [Cyanobacteria bacterium 13_1_40CM_2_61_4]